MKRLIRASLIACALGLPFGASLGDGLQNGDFANGKTKWLGEGKIVFLKPDGTISATDDSRQADPLARLDPAKAAAQPKATPILELKLHDMRAAEIYQKFRTAKGGTSLNVEVVYKASSDFKLNESAPSFTKNNTWRMGEKWYWTGGPPVYPKTDLCFRLDQGNQRFYKLEQVTPCVHWQTAKFRWDNVENGQDVTLLIIAAPGEGKLWVKSVAVSPEEK